jgi:EAL domain-containing protein (putative c-di-GMP-specific phosphodiesterase class I)
VDFGHVAVNAAAADFKQSDFAERLLERMAASAIPAECLQVEVTETVFLGRGADWVERALKTLSANGIRIALDDFGTGYASLSHLKQFPVDIVKIDRSFLRGVPGDPQNAAIIRTVVNLGRSLDLEVVAEGVETPAAEAFLIGQGCPIGQGYLYGKAAPAARVPRLLTSSCGSERKAA